MSDDNPAVRLNLRHSGSEEPAGPPQTSPPKTTQTKPSLRTSSKSGQSAGAVLRSRGKKSKPDIDDVWEDLRKRQISDSADDEHVLANREIGEVIDRVGAVVGGASKRFKKAYSQAATTPKQQRKRPSRAQTYKKRPSRPSSRSKSLHSRMAATKNKQNTTQSLGIIMRFKPFVIRYRRMAFGVALFVGVILVGASALKGGDSTSPAGQEVGQTLGSAVSTPTEQVAAGGSSGAGPTIVTETEFDLLYPAGKNSKDFEIAQVNPPNTDPVYAYIDEVDGVEIRLSQQSIPPDFQGNEAAKLQEVATNFQATDILQVDGRTVYYGYTERFGGVQSLIFIKQDVMVFISSAQERSDDTWAGYIAALK